jgi:Ca2+:H+ antiporter
VDPLLKELRQNRILWLLALVPVVLVAAKLVPMAHTLLFVLSVLAIVPLAALLSHATESVAEKTGDAAGGLLNATLGNLTELVIAAAALRAGEYALVKGSIAGAIVTNTLFMLGASFLSWRSQAPCPGVQSRYRPSGCRFALPGCNCAR